MRTLTARLGAFTHLTTAVATGVMSLCMPVSGALQTVRSSTVGTYKTPRVPPSTQGLSLAAPTVGLFIGVSEYDERAGVFPTPAHTLSAALMYEPFFNAATRSDTGLRKTALGIPANPYVKAHAKAVCAVAFSTDGSRFITASADGSASLRRTDGAGVPVALTPAASDQTQPSCSAVFSPDDAHVAISRLGAAEVWPISGTGAPVVLKHPARVGALAFTSDGSKLLTTSSDGKARIFSAGGGQPIEHAALENGCERMPLAALSPDGNTLVTAGCSVVRIGPAASPGVARQLGKHDGFVNDVFFSRDGRVLVTLGDDGTRIWSTGSGTPPARIPIPKGTVDPGVAVRGALSHDGARLAIGYAEGYVEIWPASGRGVPVSLATRGQAVRSLQFSANDQHLLVTWASGTAAVESVTGSTPSARVPSPDAPSSQFDDIRRSQAISSGRLPPRSPQLALSASTLSPDDRRILAGYRDGTIAIHAGTWSPDNTGFRGSDLTLLADLQVNSNTDDYLAVEYLMQLNGAPQQMASFRLPGKSENVTGYRVGGGRPVTKQRMLEAVDRTIANARDVLRVRQRVILVTYVSAHGWTGADGRAYLLPSDADANVPSTWIAYEDFLAPIRRFLAEPRAPSPFTDPDGADQSRLAVVIFDTCQTARYSEIDRRTAIPSLAQPGLIVVQATSPGQYAWHWTGTMESEKNITIQSEKRWGFPPPPRAERGLIVKSLSARMSALPVGTLRLFELFIDKKGSQPEGDGRMISATDWIEGMKAAVEVVLEEVPDAANPDLGAGARQEVLSQSDQKQYDFWVLKVDEGAKRPAGNARER